MGTGAAIAILVGVFVLVLLGMWLGWRARGRRTARVVVSIPDVPSTDDLGAGRSAPIPATYVSTTLGGDWLERVVAHGLGVRSAATVRVHDAGVVVERPGARDVFVPAASLREVSLAPGMAGKYVGGQGLVVLRWETGGQVLDTGLRTRVAGDREVLATAARGLVTPRTAAAEAAAPDRTSEENP
ncbi:hypothetical protein [Actinotalea sp. K2]|uniref:PH-like domain-containing protein n=1 Tax=Actinotalea sp. K2 TaxID=2939438 RepID=UPI00201767AB|nr:hypothetical protein [Actinotalea sp. K2]MCL3862827.1 hypothetical protein [Actinotalea sp. K2]